MKISYLDGRSETIHQSPAVWRANNKNIIVVLNSSKEVKSIALDGGLFMDATPANNTWNKK